MSCNILDVDHYSFSVILQKLESLKKGAYKESGGSAVHGQFWDGNCVLIL